MNKEWVKKFYGNLNILRNCVMRIHFVFRLYGACVFPHRIHLEPHTNKSCVTMLQRSIGLYFQHGVGIYCRQNDVAVTLSGEQEYENRKFFKRCNNIASYESLWIERAYIK